jgi:hypothetical protein
MYNREHSVPQSWFGSGGIKSDIVHVLPTDGYVNNRRSNYPFGEVANATYQSQQGYCKLGSCKTSGYSGTVFEVNDEIKGDMARIYFYMITRYQSECGGWGHDVFTSTYPGLETWALDMMMRWSKQDPVDAREIARNNAVYEVQGNRNPYVDYPGLEDYTWGDKMEVAFSYDNYEGGSSGETPGGTTVAMPVITPDAGTYTDYVEVSISCATNGATIYYTTGGSTPTTQSNVYSGAFRLTESGTVKAIAVKDGVTSSVASATYTITSDQGGESVTPVSGELALNNSFFGYDGSGTIAKSYADDLVGTADGVTVTYTLGSGGQRYANDSEIRVYTGNTLTVSVSQGTISKIEITIGKNNSGISSDVGTISDNVWTGNAQSVSFSAKNTSIAKLKVTVSGTTGVNTHKNTSGKRVIYNVRGQRVSNPTRGIYIVDGRKVIL